MDGHANRILARSHLPRKNLGRNPALAGHMTCKLGPVPSKKQAEKKVFAVDSIYASFMSQFANIPRHGIQREVWPRVRCFRTRIKRRQESEKVLARRHPNPIQHHVCPWSQNALSPRNVRYWPAKLATGIGKGRVVTQSKIMQLSEPLFRF